MAMWRTWLARLSGLACIALGIVITQIRVCQTSIDVCSRKLGIEVDNFIKVLDRPPWLEKSVVGSAAVVIGGDILGVDTDSFIVVSDGEPVLI